MLAVYFKADRMYLKKIAELKKEEAGADDTPDSVHRRPLAKQPFGVLTVPKSPAQTIVERCDFCWS
jgi:hypothetical protein